jgi:predicted nuclease of predicted toxin-antitoxin system
MRFLADENIPGTAVAALEAIGHDVAWVRLASPGLADRDVLSWAVRDGRVLLTFDKDFGELARASSPPGECGVVLFRLPMPKAGDAARLILDVLKSRDDWAGHFSVVEPARIRMRPLG